MDKKNLSKFCEKKVGMSQSERRHEHFKLHFLGKPLDLFDIVAVSRGSGSADQKNLKGVALALGLTLRELEEAERCHYGRCVIHISMCVQVIRKAHMILCAEPAFLWRHHTLLLIDPLLSLAFDNRDVMAGAGDVQMLGLRITQLEDLRPSAKGDLLVSINKVAAAIGRLMVPPTGQRR